MNSKELRQAAERLETTPPSELDYRELMKIRCYILATVQEDGEEKIDQKWLMECWGFRDDANWDSEDEDVESSLVDTGCYKCIEPEGMIIWCQETGLTLGRDGYTETIVQFPVSTRSQFRSLMTGLGIVPQKISGKR